MHPTSYTVEEGITYFHYPFAELTKFVRRGKEFGDNGWILTSRQGSLLTYRGFGTIENPRKELITVILMEPHYEKSLTDDERINPPKIKSTLDNYSMVIVDFSKK